MATEDEIEADGVRVFLRMREWQESGDSLLAVLGVFSSKEKAELARKAFDARKGSRKGACYVNEFVIDEAFGLAP